MTDDSPIPRLTPLRIALVYLVFGMVALVAFDLVLPQFLAADSLLRRTQFVKGAVEVGLTAGFLYLLAWYAQRSLSVANRRLERKDEALQVLLRLLRHNVRNDITIIRGHAETARESTDDPAVEESCSVILDTTDGLLHQTETVNRLRDVLVGSTEPVRFDLAAVVGDVLEDVRESHGVDPAVDEDIDAVSVRADRLLPYAIREVVENSIVHGDDPEPRVECDVDDEAGLARLRIEDDGPGIPASEVSALSSREESPLAHASGVGLWFVHWIVSGSGGDVSVRNPPDGGATVELSLPTANGA